MPIKHSTLISASLAVIAVFTLGWFFRYEPVGKIENRVLLLNRWTGEVISISQYGRRTRYGSAADAPAAEAPAVEEPAETSTGRYDYVPGVKRQGLFDEFEDKK